MNNSSAPAMTICLPDTLSSEQQFLPGIHRTLDRDRSQNVVALKNALHYIPQNLHDKLIPEFLEGLKTRAGFYCA